MYRIGSALKCRLTDGGNVLEPGNLGLPKSKLVFAFTKLTTLTIYPYFGAETLYKEYLVPLGIKRLRMQAGWDKTEQVKGIYDWAWLDHIIHDAVGRGLKPWLQTSYGNHNYEGGGGSNLGAGVPHSAVALQAWDQWVTALVERYRDKVTDWEVWNEPNFGDNNENAPEQFAAFSIRTAEIIKKIQPDAKISGLALGHIGLAYAAAFFKELHDKKKLHLFDNMTYHDYVYNPDANYLQVALLRMALDQYAPDIKLRQGENGAPSASGWGRGALGDYAWSELSQAKWDTRRMLGNLGHDIECSIFGIIEMAYTNGPINRLNYKGIIKSDSTKKVIRPKMAYYAVQNITSIFDNSLERMKEVSQTHNINVTLKDHDEVKYSKSTDRSISVYGFQNKQTKKQLYAIWNDEYIPTSRTYPTSDERAEGLWGRYLYYEKMIKSIAIIAATGANYLRLPLANLKKYEGSGIYYSATAMHASSCKNEITGVVGAGNSAGQAALFLSEYAHEVHIIVRGSSLHSKMSDYLVKRLEATSNIHIHLNTEVSALSGEHHLEEITVTGTEGNVTLGITNLFSFIGAKPCTEWISQLVVLDQKGFIMTGNHLADHQLSACRIYQQRRPQSAVWSAT